MLMTLGGYTSVTILVTAEGPEAEVGGLACGLEVMLTDLQILCPLLSLGSFLW